MQRLITIDAVAAPLDESNIDTDQLAPGRFLSKPVTPDVLLHDRRFAHAVFIAETPVAAPGDEARNVGVLRTLSAG